MEFDSNPLGESPLLPFRNTSLTNLPNEVWVPIPLWEKYYHISNYGRVKRLERISIGPGGRQSIFKEGIVLHGLSKTYNKYKKDFIYSFQSRVNIDGKVTRFQPHRLVYYCFVEEFDLNDPDTLIVSEGDGLDIRPQKLLKMSTAESTRRLYELGRLPSQFNYEDYNQEHLNSPSGKASLKNVSQYDENGKLVRCYKDITEAVEFSGVTIKKIREGAKKLVSMSKGFYWRYGNDPSLDVDIIADIMEMDDIHTLNDAFNKYVEFMKG